VVKLFNIRKLKGEHERKTTKHGNRNRALLVRLLERLADCHGVKLHIVLTYIVGDDFSTMDLKLNDSAVRSFCSKTFVLSLNICSKLTLLEAFLAQCVDSKDQDE